MGGGGGGRRDGRSDLVKGSKLMAEGEVEGAQRNAAAAAATVHFEAVSPGEGSGALVLSSKKMTS